MVRDELYKQLPNYFKPVMEFNSILDAHGYALENLQNGIISVDNNNHIGTADAATIAFWENLLKIQYRPGETLEYRRSRVLQKFNTVVPFSYGFLVERLTELFGADGFKLSVDSQTSTVKINVMSDRYGAIDLLYSLVWDILPAHLKLVGNVATKTDIQIEKQYMGAAMTITNIQTIGG